MVGIKAVTPSRWALVDSRSLKVLTPWIEGSREAVEFAHRHCRGWDLEPGLEVTDQDSYKRLRFHRYELPRMVEAKRKRRKHASTFGDLVEFHPFNAKLQRATGETQTW